MEKRIHELQTQSQLLTILQHSISETITEAGQDLDDTTITMMSRLFMTLENEKIKKQMEVARLKKL